MKISLNIFLFLGVCFFFTNCKKEESVYTLSLKVNTVNSGTVSGAGSYASGVEVILTATANSGFTFKNWTDGETVISTHATYSYKTTSEDVTLTANFIGHYSLTLQPDATSGKDALVSDFGPTTNYGTHRDFYAVSWTNGGTPVIGRGLIQFDFTAIPSGAIIDSVKLTLYGYVSTGNGSHSGTNSSVLKRVTQNWNESTVTWNNQPTSTVTDQVFLPMSTSATQNYILDITESATYMIKNPTQNFGYILKQSEEISYRRLIFGSSDNTDNTIRPKVVVYYSTLE